MARTLSMSFNWQGPMDYEQACSRVRLAEEAGVDTVWVAEAWGRDCFTILTLLARETKRITAWHRHRQLLFAHSSGPGPAFCHPR